MWLGFGADYRDEVGVEASTPLEQAYPLVFLCSDAAGGDHRHDDDHRRRLLRRRHDRGVPAGDAGHPVPHGPLGVTTGVSDAGATAGVYYDPYDFDIDADPYPLWKRMRDEVPLYYNEQYDFFALSRFDDVEPRARRLGDVPLGPGLGPRAHPGRHRPAAGADPVRGPADPRRPSRPAVAGVHAQEDERDRAPGARVLRPLARPARRHRAASTSSATSARRCRCGRSACCSASPSRTRRRSGDQLDAGLKLDDGTARGRRPSTSAAIGEMFAEYIDWRAEHPSDDLMTELLTAEFEDETGTTRRLTREEVLTYVNLLAGAGNETTHAADRLDGQGAGRAPRPAARRSPRTASLIAAGDRGDSCATRRRRRSRPGTSPATSSTTAQTVARGQHHGAAQRRRPTATSARFPDGDRFDIHRDDRPPPELRVRHPLLPRRRAGPARRPRRARRGAAALARLGGRLRTTPCRPTPRPSGAGSRSPSSPGDDGRVRELRQREAVVARARSRPRSRSRRRPGTPAGTRWGTGRARRGAARRTGCVEPSSRQIDRRVRARARPTATRPARRPAGCGCRRARCRRRRARSRRRRRLDLDARRLRPAPSRYSTHVDECAQRGLGDDVQRAVVDRHAAVDGLGVRPSRCWSAWAVPATSHSRNVSRVGLAGRERAEDAGHVGLGLDVDHRHVGVGAEDRRRRRRSSRRCRPARPARRAAARPRRGCARRSRRTPRVSGCTPLIVGDERERRLRLARRDHALAASARPARSPARTARATWV